LGVAGYGGCFVDELVWSEEGGGGEESIGVR
jgi:hypothetical protein